MTFTLTMKIMSSLYLVASFVVFASSSWSIGTRAAPLDDHEDHTGARKLAPIFHEANNGDGESNGSEAPILEDVREWVFREVLVIRIMDLFDTAAHIEMSEAQMDSYNRAHDDLLIEKRSVSSYGVTMDIYKLMTAQIQMNSALEPYLKTEGLNMTRGEQKAIMVGSDWRPGESLGANINNYAPDNFSDDEIMRLFEMSDKVRRQLASDAATGKGTLTMAEQKAINQRLFRAYREALAGLPIPVDCKHPAENDECLICRDSLETEPSVELPCKHRYHTDCAVSWIESSSFMNAHPSCALCHSVFRLPYLTTKDY